MDQVIFRIFVKHAFLIPTTIPKEKVLGIFKRYSIYILLSKIQCGTNKNEFFITTSEEEAQEWKKALDKNPSIERTFIDKTF